MVTGQLKMMEEKQYQGKQIYLIYVFMNALNEDKGVRFFLATRCNTETTSYIIEL